MRAPPPVEYVSALGRAWRGALSLLVGASVAVPLSGGLPDLAVHFNGELAAWFETPGGQAAIALGAGLMAVAAFWGGHRRSTAGERTLRWDGDEWALAGTVNGRPDQRGDVALMLDLGPWMLVRFVPHAASGAATWLPLALAGDPDRWAALRGALWNGRAGAGAARP